MVHFLVESGADIYTFNNEGFAPLHIAIINDRFNVVAYYLAIGMNVKTLFIPLRPHQLNLIDDI